jgi:clan AA aspartic protease
MKSGTVTARLEATISVRVRDSNGQERDVEAIIDTGFTGSLTLPPVVIAGFGLPWRNRGSAMLANGVVDQFDIHAAVVIWDGTPRQILVEAAATDPLVGMGMLAGHDVRFQTVPGGQVTIEKLP